MRLIVIVIAVALLAIAGLLDDISFSVGRSATALELIASDRAARNSDLMGTAK